MTINAQRLAERRRLYPWENHYYSAKYRCSKSDKQNTKWYYDKGIKFLLTKDEVEKLWFKYKAYLMKRPSIDRKNNKLGYTLENCQFIEQSLNSSKDKLKPILQYDLKGNFIKEWSSVLEASNSLKLNHSSICYAARGVYETSAKSIWRYK